MNHSHPRNDDPNKSWVSMEQHQCIVCGATFDTNALLLDKRMRKTFDRHTVTGLGLCPEHQKLYDDGYTALVACDPDKSTVGANQRVEPGHAYRTGEIAHIRRSVWADIFGKPAPTNVKGQPLALVYCDQALILHLQAVLQESPAPDA